VTTERKPRARFAQLIFIALALGLVGIIIWVGVSKDARYDRLLEAYVTVTGQLEDNGITPDAPSPEAIEGEQGATGATGQRGSDGRDATDEQVGRAIVKYCAEVGCRGLDGAPGAPGRDGTSVTGPAGTNGTNGLNGTDGAPGAPGPAGVGLSTVTCVQLDPLTTAFRFTLTDGTTNDVQGSCTPTS
jgi:hypothetical protein